MSGIKSVIPVAVATGFSILGLGMILPSLQIQATSLGAGLFVAAVILSVSSAASFLSSPFWGRLSDRVGRKPVMLTAICFTIISYIWMANADSIFELYASRILAGLTAGWMAASQAFVADVTRPEDRAGGMAVLGISFGLGFAFGPGISGYFMEGDFFLSSYAAAACACVGFLVTAVFVKEPGQHREVTGRNRLSLLQDRNLARMVALYFCVFLMFTGVEGVFALWAKTRFGLDPSGIGMFMAYSGVIMIIVQGGIGRLVRRVGEARVVVFAIACLLVAFISMPLVTGPMGILVPKGLFALAMGLHNPAMQSLFSRCAPEGRQGGVMGIAQSTMSLARIGGPAWAGWFLAAFGPNMPFVIGSVLLIPIVIASVFVTRLAGEVANANLASAKAAE